MTASHTCDTSVLVPALLSWHPAHRRVRSAMDEVAAVPAHVLLECYSVLTRLPSPHRIAAEDAGEVLAAMRLSVLGLPPEDYASLVSGLAEQGVRGGAVYDGLVGATAKHHSLALFTADRRARAAYDAVGVSHELI